MTVYLKAAGGSVRDISRHRCMFEDFECYKHIVGMITYSFNDAKDFDHRGYCEDHMEEARSYAGLAGTHYEFDDWVMRYLEK